MEFFYVPPPSVSPDPMLAVSDTRITGGGIHTQIFETRMNMTFNTKIMSSH